MAVIFIIIEAVTLGLTTIWFAAGAIGAWLVSLTGANFWIQLIVFLIASFVLLYYTRPIAKKVLRIGHERTNAAGLIGKVGLVTEKIDVYDGIGQVKVNGQIWSARSVNDLEITEGEKVWIRDIQGVKLIVEQKVEEEE